MTRETKVGLAVASSFIGLVAIVVATKYHGNDPAPQVAQVVTPGETTPVIDNGKKDEQQHKKDAKHSDRTEKKREKGPTSDVAQADLRVPGPFSDKADGPPPTFPPPGDARDQAPLPPNFEEDQQKKKRDLEKAARDAELPPPGDTPRPPPGASPFDLAQNNAPSVAPPTVDPSPSVPPPSAAPPSVPPPPVSPPTVPPPSVVPPPGPPPSPFVVKDPPPPPLPPDQPDGKLSIKPTPPARPGDAPPSPPSVLEINPMPPAVQPPAVQPPGPAPAPPLTVPVPVPPTKGSAIPPEPLGANPGPLGTPMVVAPLIASNAPKVRNLGDVQPYTTKLGDSSFEAISKQVYGDQSGRYAQALLQFNRDYPNADMGLRQNPPVLKAGQKVFIPSIDFLEQHYGSAIGAANTPAVVGTTPPPLGSGIPGPAPTPVAPPIGVTPPMPLTPVTPVFVPVQETPRAPVAPAVAPMQPVPAVQPPTSDAFKRYRVPDQGQHILEIAQKMLGDRGRWNEIYRLNPNVSPQFPIPGGTEIRLPANAVVP